MKRQNKIKIFICLIVSSLFLCFETLDVHSSYNSNITMNQDVFYNTTYNSEYFEYSSSDSSMITSYTGNEEIVEIPSENNGVAVTYVDADVFNFNTTLKTLIVPESVTEINDFNLLGCDNLEEIILKAYNPITVLVNTYIDYNFWHTFIGMPESVKIYVPDIAYNTYKNSKYWSMYRNQIYKISERDVNYSY